MENIIWLGEQPDPSLRKLFTGTFQLHSDWGESEVGMSLSATGTLKGYFSVGGQSFELIGSIGKSGLAFGFLLEPVSAVPMALFRIRAGREGLTLELDVPEFADLLDNCQIEQFKLERVSYTISDTLSLAP